MNGNYVTERDRSKYGLTNKGRLSHGFKHFVAVLEVKSAQAGRQAE